MNLNELQAEVGKWGERNFPNATPIDCVLGVNEESGELAHAFLKRRQGIRGTEAEHDAEGRDAVGDVVVYLAHLCELMGWELESIVDETWATVKYRDWQTNPGNGRE